MKKGVLEQQIRHTLAMDEKSRNSDIRLTQMLWWNHYRSYMKMIDGKVYVNVANLFDLPREDNIKRIRAKIQNELKEFLPTDPSIAKKRGWQEDEWRKFLGYPVAGEDNQTL
jgi:hypothetical protein